MPKQETSQITPDEAKASLGIATNLMSQLMPKAQPQNPQNTPEMPQEQGENPEPQEPAPQQEKPDQGADLELTITQKFDQIRQELKADNQREIDELKKTIEAALAEDDEQDKTA